MHKSPFLSLTDLALVPGAFYLVKLKPYERLKGPPDTDPPWEPMQWCRDKFHRAGVIYRFPLSEVDEIGDRVAIPDDAVDHNLPTTPMEALVSCLAKMTPQGEVRIEDGVELEPYEMDPEDAVEVLNNLIGLAREIYPITP